MATHRYPSDIATLLPAYMGFTFHKHTGYTTDELKTANQELFGNTMSTYGAIALPMPNNLTDSINIGWQDANDQSILSGAIDRAGNAVSSSVAAYAKMTQGTAIENHSAMVFNNVNACTYSFFWTLTPRSKAEADEIMQIVNAFQMASLPSLAGAGMTFLYPDIVKISFLGKSAFKGISLLPLVVTGVSVKYGSDVTFMVYEDGNVPEVNLQISLTEIASRNRQIVTSLKPQIYQV
jgi:hypothetical protein